MTSIQDLERLRKDGKEILSLIKKEIQQLSDQKVSTRPKNVRASVLGEGKLLWVGGVEVPLQINQYYGGPGISASPRLVVRVEGIRDHGEGYRSVVKDRVFQRSYQSFQTTYGFNIKKIAEYCLKWLTLKDKQDRIEANRESRQRSEDIIQEQWQTEVNRLQPPSFIHMEATPRGIRVEMTLNAEQAAAVIKALQK